MELIVTVPDTFYSMSLIEQERTILKVLEKQKTTRQTLIKVLQTLPETHTDLTEEQQLALVDSVREEIYQKKHES
ncbi:MAG: hypothetical protein HQM12_07175 [SAR324 cluster bacterium]|nr:hypothetical protein [SAR324 cluster bacterium]MBF0349777.1 hypothetical protein [SAR324 cluster bacterium]